MNVDLSKYNNRGYKPGGTCLLRASWFFLNIILFKNPFVISSGVKVFVLRAFGAKVGSGVVLKPNINIKYPWNLEIGSHSWIGEQVWLDSLGKIKIGNNVCISQGCYLCTGNHDWSKREFDLIIKPITLKDGVWVGAFSVLLPGVTMNENSISTAGSVVTKDTKEGVIYSGNPASERKVRSIRLG